MKRDFGSLTTVLLAGTLFLAMGAAAGAQQAPPASQQPMEIPAQQYPPQQGGPQQGMPPQGGPQQGAPQQSQNDGGAGRVSFIHGDVSTQHDGSSDWAAATLNTPVVNGDHLSTGKNSRAEIQLDHANTLRMSDQATANVVNLSRSQIQLQVGQGLVNYDVLKNSDASIEIDTPNIAVRPQAGEGSYRIQVNSDGETIVDVRKGAADISTPQGSTRVERDQRITIEGNADNAQYQISGAPGRDDWDKWNADRDHAIESAQSWQHTNPYYTGSEDLDAYGHWSNVPDYGDVWFPAAGPGWAPYRDGRWVYEPYYGWTWVSYEPWGWAPYHYGRWFVYGGNWGWWPGPVYGGYRPIWAPAYVSFFGFGGGGWGVGFGFGFGSVGWLAIGPGDHFYPWYGRGINRVNGVGIYDVHNDRGGFEPLRAGGRGYSNLDHALNDERVRAGVSSMPGNQFGRGAVPAQQQRFDSASLRQAHVMTGANPVSPSRASYNSTDRQVNSSAISNRAGANQRFFSSSARTGTPQASRSQGGFASGGNAAASSPTSRSSLGSTQAPRSSASPSSQPGSSAQSSRPGWRTFNPPSQPSQSNGGNRASTVQGGSQSRPGFSQPSGAQPQAQTAPRASSGNYGYTRPALNMQQPVVRPRTSGAYSPTPAVHSAPSGGISHGVPSSGGSRSVARSVSSRGSSSSGGSRGRPSSGGGHSSSGHKGR